MIRAEHLSKSFGRNTVLRDVSVEIASGSSLVVIGGSGTGKSVLLKCLLGLQPADHGTVEIGGTKLTRKTRDEILAHTGMLFQGAALFDSLPVWENVAFRLLRQGMKRGPAKDRAVEKLARVGLGADVADRLPAELSGGMQKRAGLARAIAADPAYLFFDEPTAGLDPIMAQVINGVIRSIVTEMGATALTITHDMTSVRTIADRVTMLHEGLLRWEGPVAEIEDPQDPYVAQFVAGRAEGPISPLR